MIHNENLEWSHEASVIAEETAQALETIFTHALAMGLTPEDFFYIVGRSAYFRVFNHFIGMDPPTNKQEAKNET